jgi:DNA-damage-inducible protein J
MSNINIRIDDQLKSDSEQLFASLGLNMSTAINIFLRKSLVARGLPFPVTLPATHNPTLAEVDAIADDPTRKRYHSAAELIADCLSGEDDDA